MTPGILTSSSSDVSQAVHASSKHQSKTLRAALWTLYTHAMDPLLTKDTHSKPTWHEADRTGSGPIFKVQGAVSEKPMDS